jgi:ABC-type nickel/cobalt efflux system permease component RcnA
VFTILAFGFLIGMQHAMEADHLAAVASLVSGRRSLRESLRQGAVWGLGHSLTLFCFAGVVVVLDSLIPASIAQLLEQLVGVMLILLGVDLLRRLIRERVHFHAHHHGDLRHFHAHSHRQSGLDHAVDPHQHKHPKGFPLRALLVGMTHGLAGSAALILLTLESVQSPQQGLLYILFFGLGSIVGMALLSLVISLPLRYSARNLSWAHNGLKGGVGLVTIGLGATLLVGG